MNSNTFLFGIVAMMMVFLAAFGTGVTVWNIKSIIRYRDFGLLEFITLLFGLFLIGIPIIAVIAYFQGA